MQYGRLDSVPTFVDHKSAFSLIISVAWGGDSQLGARAHKDDKRPERTCVFLQPKTIKDQILEHCWNDHSNAQYVRQFLKIEETKIAQNS